MGKREREALEPWRTRASSWGSKEKISHSVEKGKYRCSLHKREFSTVN